MDIQPDRLIRLTEVMDLTGLSRSSVYRKKRAGDFPESVELGARGVAWRQSEVWEWMASRPKSRGSRGS